MEKEKKIFKVELEIEHYSREAVIAMIEKLIKDDRVMSFNVEETED